MMRTPLLAGVLAAAAAALALAGARASGPDTGTDAAPEPAVRVGVFDSRAVAVAYYRSDAFAELRATLDEPGAIAAQERAHEQSFSNAPIRDLHVHLEDELPGIAAKAGVDVIVSKWDLVWRNPSARFVDVTDALVEAFEPDDETRRVVRELLATEPVPLDELDHEH